MGTHATSEGHRQGLRKGTWTAEEDALLIKCMEKYVVARWSLIPKLAGLNRWLKSCRLRWLNYLCPSIKRGRFEDDEVDLIIRLHKLLGNRWSLIAGRIPSKQLVIEKDEKQASARYAEVIEPQPQAIPWNWTSSTDDEADQVMHKELNIPKQPLCSNNNTTCTGNIIDTDTVNFSMAHNEVKMMQEPQTKFGSEDIGGRLEGFGGWEDMNADSNVGGDFRPI